MNVKKILIGFGVVVVLLVALMAGAVLFTDTEPVVAEQSLSDGVLTVAVIPGDDVYCYEEEGAYVGIEPGLAQAMAVTGQVECTLVAYETKAAAMTALTNREVDLVLGRMDSTDEAISGFTTSAVYGSGSLYLVTPKNSFVNTLAMLAEQVVVVSDDITMDMKLSLQDYSLVTPMSATAQDDYVSLLNEGVAAAALCSEWEAVSLALSGANVQVQAIANGPNESYVAVMQSGEPTLYTLANLQINAYLDGDAES